MNFAPSLAGRRRCRPAESALLASFSGVLLCASRAASAEGNEDSREGFVSDKVTCYRLRQNTRLEPAMTSQDINRRHFHSLIRDGVTAAPSPRHGRLKADCFRLTLARPSNRSRLWKRPSLLRKQALPRKPISFRSREPIT